MAEPTDKEGPVNLPEAAKPAGGEVGRMLSSRFGMMPLATYILLSLNKSSCFY